MPAPNNRYLWSLWLVTMLTCEPATSVDLYQMGSLLVYRPNNTGGYDNYFGYSVLLLDDPPRLIVGATEWNNENFNHGQKDVSFGQIFKCDLNTQQNGACHANLKYNAFTEIPDKNLLFGHSISEIPGKFLVMCAPLWRQKDNINANTQEWRFKGACVTAPPSQRPFIPFEDSKNNYRNETVNNMEMHVPYYAHGLAGFSSAVSPDHQWLLLGAPGFHDFKGGIARYKLDNTEFYLRSEVSFDSLHSNSYMGYSLTTALDPDGRQLVVSGAPRGGNRGQGEVIVFSLGDDRDKTMVLSLLNGTQMGEYFGASVLAVDVNGDNRTDLLVGAPLHKYDKVGDWYDQGVVYVYNSELTDSGFQLNLCKIVRGSGASRARFGYSLADLGDVDGDGFNDVAIGAPFEEFGALYIFRSGPQGLRDTHSQRIAPNRTDLKGFGFSLSSGVDVDKNGCKDLAVGSVFSNTAATLRCSPMLVVKASVDVGNNFVHMCRGVVALSSSTSQLSAKFCLSVDKPRKEWETAKVDIISNITQGKQLVGRLENGSDEYFTAKWNMTDECRTLQIQWSPTEKEITLKLTLSEKRHDEEGDPFDINLARLGEDSVLSDELTAYFVDCGEDNVCTPNFELQVDKFSDPFVPGSRDHKLGFNVTLTNSGDIAYLYTMRLNMPLTELKNIPRDCVKNGSTLTCDPGDEFGRDSVRTWTFELLPLEPFLLTRPLNFAYELLDCGENVTQAGHIDIDVQLRSNMSITGKSSPERIVFSSTTPDNETQTLKHVFTIINDGPSDCPEAFVEFSLAAEVTVATDALPACELPPATTASLVCVYNVSVGTARTLTIVLPLTVNFYMLPRSNPNGLKIETQATLTSTCGQYKRNATVTTTYQIEKARAIWPIIVGVIVGLLLIALIVYTMYKMKFFRRSNKEKLDKMKEEVRILQAD